MGVHHRYADLRRTMPRRQLRREYGAVIRGVRKDSTEPPTVRDIRDALTVAYPRLVFIGWTAAALHGAGYTDGRLPEIWLPTQRKRDNTVIRTGHLPTEDVTTVLGRRATTGARTAIDLARYVYGDEAIAAVDQCLRIDEFDRSVTEISELRRYLATHPGLHRGRRVREVLREAGVGADSPWETYTRLAVHRSGMRLFVPQTPVPGTNHHVDLGAVEFKVAVEYDGAPHRESAQHKKDVKRWGEIGDAGWHVVLVTAGLLVNERAAVLHRIATRLWDRGWRGAPPIYPLLHLPDRRT
jgi:very-short-patch-repair endonuclease